MFDDFVISQGYKEVIDDFCPSYKLQDGTMLARVSMLSTEEDTVLVCVSGQDDLSLSLEFSDVHNAREVFTSLFEDKRLSISELHDQGFTDA